MIIDWHTHLIPPQESEKPEWDGRCQMTIEKILDAQDRAGIDITVVSNTHHRLHRRTLKEALAAVWAKSGKPSTMHTKPSS